MDLTLEDLSMVRVARTLNVSEGAIYYYFRKRDDLVRAVLTRSALQFSYQPLEGDWHTILTNYSLKLFDALVKRPGSARYFLSSGISNLEQMRVFVRVLAAVMASGLTLEQALSVYRLYIMTAIRAAHSHDEYHAYWDSCPANERLERLTLLQQATQLEGVDFMPIPTDPDYFDERALLVNTLALLGKGIAEDELSHNRTDQHTRGRKTRT